MKREGMIGGGFHFAVFVLLVAMSVGRFDPAFVPLEIGGLTSNQIIFFTMVMLLAVGGAAQLGTPTGSSYFTLWIVVLSIWAFVSSFWSIAGLSGTLKAVSYLAAALCALHLAHRLTAIQIIAGTFYAVFYVVFASLILSVLFPNTAGTTEFHDGAWRGLFMQKNVLGRAALLLAVFSVLLYIFVDYGRSRYVAVTGFLMAVFVMIMSSSATAFLVFVMFMIALPMVVYVARRTPSFRFVVYFNMASIALYAIVYVPDFLEAVTGVTGRSVTLTGRIPLWEFAIEYVSRSPFIGYGLEGFFVSPYLDEFFSLQRWIPDHAHNGLLDLTLELGLVGLALFLLCASRYVSLTIAMATISREAHLLMISVFLLMFLMNITESNLFRSSNMIWFLFMLSGFVAMRQITGSKQPHPDRDLKPSGEKSDADRVPVYAT